MERWSSFSIPNIKLDYSLLTKTLIYLHEVLLHVVGH